MSDKTRIEWADASWNPIVGCSRVSLGCKNCYAEGMAVRFARRWGVGEIVQKGRWSGRTILKEKVLDQPLHWKAPRRIFVCSMGDLFHESVPFDWVRKIMVTISTTPRHSFLFLTKRPRRMREYFHITEHDEMPSNLWLGVSVENQATADERIPILLEAPAAVRFVSVEPMLGPVDLHKSWGESPLSPESVKREWITMGNEIHWVICGAETGPGARPMKPEWARNLRDQCGASGIPFFFKKDSDGNRTLDGIKCDEMPEEEKP